MIRRTLIAWGKANPQPRPWRGIEDPWLGLLAELLLENGSESQLHDHFTEMCVLFPTPDALLSMPVERLDGIRNRFTKEGWLERLLDVAARIGNRDLRELSATELSLLLSIPLSTAAKFASSCLRQHTPVVTRDVARWLARLFAYDLEETTETSEWVGGLMAKLTPAKDFRHFNFALVDFTEDVCRQVGPRCHACPFNETCATFTRPQSTFDLLPDANAS